MAKFGRAAAVDDLQAGIFEPGIEPSHPCTEQTRRSHFASLGVIETREVPWPNAFYIRFTRLHVRRGGDEVVNLLFEFGAKPTSVGATGMRAIVGMVKEAVFEVASRDALAIFQDGEEDVVKRVVSLLEVHGVQGDEERAHFHLHVFPHMEFAKEAPVVFQFEGMNVVGRFDVIAQCPKNPGREWFGGGLGEFHFDSLVAGLRFESRAASVTGFWRGVRPQLRFEVRQFRAAEPVVEIQLPDGLRPDPKR